jgi:hypothetical protein
MKAILLNILVLLIVASPLLALELYRSRSQWIDEHHGGLSLALWVLTLLAVYIWVLPHLGLQPNWHGLSPYP